MSLEKVAGREVVTLEGIAERERYADAFAAAGALQCGFCTPGILVRTKSLLDKDPELTREKAARHLGAHLCRCTGYVKILDAIEALARGESPAPSLAGGVGARAAKHKGAALSAGSRPFIDDLAPEGLLHAVLRLADHARADVVRIGTGAALAEAGLEAVFAAADVPGDLRVGLIHKDWPVLIRCYLSFRDTGLRPRLRQAAGIIPISVDIAGFLHEITYSRYIQFSRHGSPNIPEARRLKGRGFFPLSLTMLAWVASKTKSVYFIHPPGQSVRKIFGDTQRAFQPIEYLWRMQVLHRKVQYAAVLGA